MIDDSSSPSVILPNQISDGELLYRSIRLIEENFHREADGQIRLSSQAFADRSKEPSVYRHILCHTPPSSNPPRKNETDAVVALLARTIRENSPLLHGTNEYQVDIRPEPDDHPAHAVIFARPEFPTDKPFRRLKELLARIIEKGWVMPPSEEFIRTLSPK